MAATEEEVLAALGRLRAPGADDDLLKSGTVRNLVVHEGRVVFDIAPAPAAQRQAVERQVRTALLPLEGVRAVSVRPPGGAASLKLAGPPPPRGGATPGHDSPVLPEVRHVVAVASGKGGVGKSTVAVNLAVALAARGLRVGLLDADIYGPSIPLMMGVDEQPKLTPDKKLVPFERYGVRLMSLGFLVEPGAALIWRGPMVMKAIDQLLRDVTWGALDVLVVDLPPGTGDAQLTLAQKTRLSGAVIVTTPQDVALADAIKGVAMFRKLDVPILGLIENMSYFVCPKCSDRSEIFGHGGGLAEARRMGVPCLGQIPLNPAICRGGDEGRPVATDPSTGPLAEAFAEAAAALSERLELEAVGSEPSGTIFDRFRKLWTGPGPAD